MSDGKFEAKLLLVPSISLVYSDETEQLALQLYLSSTKEMRTYIVGCLLLTLTASVLPRYTLLADRIQTLRPMTLTTSAVAELDGVARSLAEAGFFCQRAGSGDSGYGGSCGSSSGGGSGGCTAYVCFHCNVRLVPEQLDTADPLQWHRSASPNCYYARFAELARTGGAAADRLGVSADARRYERALRKLSGDLGAGCGIQLAAEFGYEARSLALWATRQFMRCNGACPNRAGDLVALAHESDGLFPELLLATFDVQRLLGLLDLNQRLR